MSGYTKLFSSILTSSVWTEPTSVRICWITMLALANQHGEVEAAVPGLARTAGVTLEEAKQAIEILSAPDPWSRTKANDGRRIEEMDGGWLILNHGKYREKSSAEDRKEQDRVRSQRYRSRHAPSRSVTEDQASQPLLVGSDSEETEPNRTESNKSNTVKPNQTSSRHAGVTLRHAPSRSRHAISRQAEADTEAEAEARGTPLPKPLSVADKIATERALKIVEERLNELDNHRSRDAMGLTHWKEGQHDQFLKLRAKKQELEDRLLG